MLYFFVTSAIIWGLTYLIYIIFMARETRFSFNRIFLLSALSLGIFLPLVNLLVPISRSDTNPVFELSPITIGEFSETFVNVSSTVNLYIIFLIIYITGSLFILLRFLIGWTRIHRLAANAQLLDSEAPSIFISKELESPIFWSGKIILPDSLPIEGEEYEVILRHEKAHAQLKHHYDLILLHLLRVFFWFNPLFYLMVRELRLVHEYQADQKACSNYSRKQYGNLLIQFSLSGVQQYQQAHGIFSHQLKNRLIMLTRKSSTKKSLWKYLSAISLVSVLLAGLIVITAPGTQAQDSTYERSFDVAPVFPGCADLEGEEKQSCGLQKLLGFIHENVKYPEKSKADKIEGTIYISFVVTTDGRVDEVEVLRSPDEEIEKEALRVMKVMNEEGIIWEPGLKDGKPVAARLHLPIKFTLDEEDSE